MTVDDFRDAMAAAWSGMPFTPALHFHIEDNSKVAVVTNVRTIGLAIAQHHWATCMTQDSLLKGGLQADGVLHAFTDFSARVALRERAARGHRVARSVIRAAGVVVDTAIARMAISNQPFPLSKSIAATLATNRPGHSSRLYAPYGGSTIQTLERSGTDLEGLPVYIPNPITISTQMHPSGISIDKVKLTQHGALLQVDLLDITVPDVLLTAVQGRPLGDLVDLSDAIFDVAVASDLMGRTIVDAKNDLAMVIGADAISGVSITLAPSLVQLRQLSGHRTWTITRGQAWEQLRAMLRAVT